MTTKRVRAAAATLAIGALLGAGCGGGDTTSDSDSTGAEGGSGDVTLTWWHNGSADPARSFFADAAAEFEEANPGVTIEVVPKQNEDLRTQLQVALQSDPPDVFQQWGGGEMANQVEAGKLMDLTEPAADTIETLGGAVAGWQVQGATYGLPYTLGVVGFWYNTALFEEAGITEPPATMDEWYAAVEALKSAGITPVAVGAGDLWPAAFYYNYAAVRACSQEALETAGLEFDFSDPCFVEAGELVEEIVAAEPFQNGFLASSAQQGAQSSAGLLANGEAAMELMGHWNPGVMQGLTEGEIAGGNLGWFRFPTSEGAGDPDAMVGGGDGYSCSVDAPPECVEFLEYMVSADVQQRFAETTGLVPIHPEASDSVTDENLQEVLEARDSAPYIQIYLDVAYGPNVGGALNDSLGLVFAGTGDAQDVVDAMQQAAESE